MRTVSLSKVKKHVPLGGEGLVAAAATGRIIIGQIEHDFKQQDVFDGHAISIPQTHLYDLSRGLVDALKSFQKGGSHVKYFEKGRILNDNPCPEKRFSKIFFSTHWRTFPSADYEFWPIQHSGYFSTSLEMGP